MSDVRTIAVTAHGRYLIELPLALSDRPLPVLVGMHGYGEDAATHLDRLKSISGSDRWLIVSVQAIHRFYRRRSEHVVASWMTREDRELVIADNVAYVSAVLDDVRRTQYGSGPIVYAGFSQGAAMAFRAAVLGPTLARGVIALGGDIPPELESSALSRCSHVLIGRGLRDEWYTAEKLDHDRARLLEAGVDATHIEVDAAHEWTAPFSDAASTFLRRFA